MKSGSWPRRSTKMNAPAYRAARTIVQTERVAACANSRDGFAHELKNPLFPLHLTVEIFSARGSQTSEGIRRGFSESYRDASRGA